MSSHTTVPGLGASYEPPATQNAPPAAPPEPCRNCGAERHGEYCHGCGQHFLEDRLTFRLLASELWERVTFERGFLRTLVDMTVRPGIVIRRYVDGQRKRYVSPFTYLLFGAAVSLLVFRLFSLDMAAFMQERIATASGTGGESPLFTTAQNEAYVRLLMGLMQHTTLTSLGMCALFAPFVRLFFRRSGINLVEAIVFALFTFAHVLYLSVPLALVAMWGLRSPTLFTYSSFPLYVAVCGLAGAQYFGRPARSVLKTVAALIIAYGIFSLILGVGILAYVLLTVK